MKKLIAVVVITIVPFLVLFALQELSEKVPVPEANPEEQEERTGVMTDVTERYHARIDRVDVVFEHKDYTRYRLTTNGLVREGELNTERGYKDDINATVYVLNWQKPEGERIYYVRLTDEPGRLYILDSNRDIIIGSALTLVSQLSEVNASRAITEFSWKSKTEAETEGYPRTKVMLSIERSDGTIEEKDIATVDGSCDVMPVEAMLALGSEQLLCYYAGFGYQFRVIESEDSFEVQQKEIEEASPDYNPPIAEFVTILTINKGE